MTADIQFLAEKLESDRSRWLKANVMGFVLWYGLRIVDKYLLDDKFIVLGLIQLVGIIIWIVSLFYIRKIMMAIKKNGKVGSVLNDEFTESNRMRSWRSGFVAMILTQGVMLGSSFFISLPAAFSAEITILVGVVSSIGAFLLYHR